MINGDEQRSKVAKRKATAPVGGIFQKKKVRIGLTPVHQIESDLEQLKGQMIFSIKNGILWNMTVSSMFDPASSVRSTRIRKRF